MTTTKKIKCNENGNFFIEIKGKESEIINAINYLKKEGIGLAQSNISININRNKCVNCGACTAVCEASALNMDANWHIQVDSKKCLTCKSCKRACPTRAISYI
ncbi:4Fe-4S binding protein [Clostridiaceae bacterium M8S5]|nr:4Fe-4S binding protein [Clostridiaceae bacterium M8S5]